MNSPREISSSFKMLKVRAISMSALRQENESIETYLLKRVLQAYHEMPSKTFEGYLQTLIEANTKIDLRDTK